MSRKIIIIGAVAGGATVAAQIRRLDQTSEVILIDKGEHISFSNCGMPYYIGGVATREDIITETEAFASHYNVEVRTNAEVTLINRQQKEITYTSNDGDKIVSYDKLILSPGASATMPAIEGLNSERTFSLHTIPDMDAIHAYIEDYQPQTCAIVGAGFVGMEMVENLQQHGITCTIIDRSKQVMKVVDKDMASHIQEHLESKGVQVLLEDGLDLFSDNGSTLNLTSGKTVQADMTIMATGIKPNTKIAEDSSLQVGETGALKVNAYMQTNDTDIYALGDVIQLNDYLTNTPRHVALAGPAHRQAFIIANHLQNKPVAYDGVQGTAIFKVFDLTVGATGLNKTALDNLNIPYKEVTHSGMSHAGYYPGATKNWLKILFNEKDGTIYGAQVIGKDDVDKRLGILATAMKGRLTVADLTKLELGYAPPYSSPKDLINIIGYKAEGMMES